jgi:hypothetical protein
MTRTCSIFYAKQKAKRKHLGENAAQNARRRFDLEQQVEEYPRWYSRGGER